MRLLTKTTICFFAAMVVLLFSTGYYLFQQFNKQLQDRSDKELLSEEDGWIRYLDNNTGGGTGYILKTSEVSVYPTSLPVTPYAILRDVTGDNFRDRAQIPFRELTQVVPVNGVAYLIIIRRSLEQRLLLVAGFTRMILIVFAALVFITVIFNWIINRSLWVPFNRSLGKIKNAELQRMDAVHFEKTGTYEFNELNEALNGLARKIARDFRNMKEFTEHAAHEMQTPVAIVQSKLEVLLQQSNLSDAQLQSVAEASEVLNRLGKLNQGLLLLSRIENNQYFTTELIDLATVVRKYLVLFADMINEKKLSVETIYEAALPLPLHPVLVDSLISNLVGNAIKYNYPGGYVRICVDASRFRIGNSSRLEPIPADKVFNRFYNSKLAGESSNGLGLAIANRIAEGSGLTLTYQPTAGEHTFILSKNRPEL